MVSEDIHIMELAGSGFFDEACAAQLAINFDSHASKKGAFKIAFFSTCSMLLQEAVQCNCVCAKACFTEDRDGKVQTCPLTGCKAMSKMRAYQATQRLGRSYNTKTKE